MHTPLLVLFREPMKLDTPDIVDLLVQRVKHFLILATGHTIEQATDEEFYNAFSQALREEIMVNWTAQHETIAKKKLRTLHYFSMEYLPGRLLGANITNMGAEETVRAVAAKLGRNISSLLASEPDGGLGNGGLGRLASCFLESLATLHYPARGYGLRYQYGVFEQEIWNGVQVERPDCWLLNTAPWEVRRDAFAVQVHYGGEPVHAINVHGQEAYHIRNFEEVRALPYDIPVIGYSSKSDYSVLSLRLWSTKESPRNFALQRYNAGSVGQAAENTTLTDVLYPNDNHDVGKRIRLKQEFLLSSASLQDLIRRHIKHYGDMTEFADKVRIQINDTHPALSIVELVRHLTKNHNYSWQQAWETTQEIFSYTNHTILREALEEWNEHRLAELLPRQFLIIQKLNQEFCQSIRTRYPNDEEKVRRMSIIENGQVKMAHLAIVGSHRVNGVAELHSQILRERLFPDFASFFPKKFTNVTNGVTHRRWLLHANPSLAAFISKRIGDSWITQPEHLSRLLPFAKEKESQTAFLLIKQKQKEALLHHLAQEIPCRDRHGAITCHFAKGCSDALFDVQIKRIHEYKRQLLFALFLIERYQSGHPFKRLALFAGKAAPGYLRAKQIIRLLSALCRKINEQEGPLRIQFIENYNVSQAEKIIPAADLSEQISTAGFEASGTGNMKLALNGALTIGTRDGANIEMEKAVRPPYWPFSFGHSASSILTLSPQSGQKVYQTFPSVARALDSLIDGTFAENPEEEKDFRAIYETLLHNDPYHTLADLPAYIEAQTRVEALFQKPEKWAEHALHNIAAMGYFSSDRAIETYASEIWHITPSPLDPEILASVREQYSEADRCRF